MATKKKFVEIKPVEMVRIPLKVIGTAPLIVHNWDEKAKRKLLDTYMGTEEIMDEKEPKDPMAEFIGSLYWLEGRPTKEEIKADAEKAFATAIKNGARFGFPISSIKKAANTAAYHQKWVPNRSALRATYFLRCDDAMLAEIKTLDGRPAVPEMREDMVKIGQGSPDIRYRGWFPEWRMDFDFEYNEGGQFSPSELLTCIQAGGILTGIGEWRPERDGNFGTFRVEEG